MYPMLLKSLHQDPLNICELFWDVKMDNELVGKRDKKPETQNGHTLPTADVK